MLAALFLLSGTGWAEEPRFWDQVASPSLLRYQQELRLGRQLLEASDTEGEIDPGPRDSLVRAAADHFRRAAVRLPDRVEAHYWLGVARFELGEDEGAVAELLRARAIAPASAFDAEIAFKLGVAYTRMARFEEAVVEYDRALEIGLDVRRPASLNIRSVALSNKAEVLMGLGRLNESIEAYRMAFDTDDRNFGALWGLACALDRDGQLAPARETASRALGLDPALNDIVGSHVFFVPAYERYYYLGLAFEARGDSAGALAQWQAYVAGAGPEGHWTGQASRHIESSSPAPRPPRPRRGLTRRARHRI
ncbi:MAG: tetratricopeptide repeat protein [Deltaproteobacteria bacterium]|nr:tetratricopeptide repeat protein [Deltaproteobacteria bacterium]